MSYRRIAANAIFLYGRSIICMFFALFSNRWVLNGLGSVDYGLFCVVGSIILFITFFNGVLSSSSSRYFSYTISDFNEVNKWFNIAFAMHVFLAVVLVAIGWVVGMVCIQYLLNIPVGRLEACKKVFYYSLTASFFSMVAIPFSAMFIAKQKMWFTALFGVLNSALTFSFALTIDLCQGDKLCYYAEYMCYINIFLSLVEIMITVYCFRECRLCCSNLLFQRKHFKELLLFSGWQLLGNFGYVFRNQGTAILVNKYFGPVLNSSFGIANQVSTQSMTISTALTTAFVPEITNLRGQRDMKGFSKLTFDSCKYGTFLAMFFTVPLCFEISFVLKLWLKNPPPYTSELCVLVIIAFLMDKLTAGIGSALSAEGKIAGIQMVDGFLYSLSVFAIWLFFLLGFPVFVLGYVFIVMRLLCIFSRLYFSSRILKWKVITWVREVVIPLLPLVFLNVFYLGAIRMFMDGGFIRLGISCLGSALISLVYGGKRLFPVELRNKLLEKLRN